MSETLGTIIATHFRRYPLMEPQDLVKLVYQNEFGCGHLVRNEGDALARIRSEHSQAAETGANGLLLAESIGNGLCRANLGAVSEAALPVIAALFCATAGTHKGNAECFRRKLGVLQLMAEEGSLGADFNSLNAYIEKYLMDGFPPVHHSEAYRRAYAPHYRVVREDYINFLGALFEVYGCLEKGKPLLVAIDGRCGSGKTYLANLICGIWDCEVAHMDDFFLPPKARTEARLRIPGGNVDHERFKAEVLLPLSKGESARYRPYDCHLDKYLPPVLISGKKPVIVEGSYSLHPSLSQYYGLRIFVTCSQAVQQRRLAERNGEMLYMFKNVWIPLEERYFSALDIQSACNIVVDTTDF